jgi:hypothetical protein
MAQASVIDGWLWKSEASGGRSQHWLVRHFKIIIFCCQLSKQQKQRVNILKNSSLSHSMR